MNSLAKDFALPFALFSAAVFIFTNPIVGRRRAVIAAMVATTAAIGIAAFVIAGA